MNLCDDLFIDGRSIVDAAHYDAFCRLLQAEQPQVVFTHRPIDNHPDHRAISLLVYDAWLRRKKSFALYYYEVSDGEDTVQFAPSHYVDISASEPRKRAACYAHATQAPARTGSDASVRLESLRLLDLGLQGLFSPVS